jgi:predicted nucleic acid-binding protein
MGIENASKDAPADVSRVAPEDASKDAPNKQTAPVPQLVGPDHEAKLMVAAAAVNPPPPAEVALKGGKAVMREKFTPVSRLYRLPAHVMPTQSADIEALARLWERESLLQDVVLYVDAHDVDASASAPGHAADAATAVTRLIAQRGRGRMILGVSDAWPQLGREPLPIRVAKPTVAERHIAWKSHEWISDEIAGTLARQFELSAASIKHIAAAVPEEQRQDPTLDTRLWDMCRQYVRPKIDALAQRLVPKAKKDALVLPKQQERQLEALEQQVRHRWRVYDQWEFAERMTRGLGISALFAGESGTGKTMAAEVIADNLALDLYRIDLSAVVNKYIGETEKNLRRLFDAAEEGGVILFFDECDALFTRRTEVKDSHDRYANIEVNYLLQRMEAYTGLAILATNAKNLLDPAFLRRLRFVVDFPFPSEVDRAEIWRKAFPEGRHDALDYPRLARLRLSGGNIQSIAINAAFLAAQRGEAAKITMKDVLAAARDEFVKLDRPISEADFRVEEPKRKVDETPVEVG